METSIKTNSNTFLYSSSNLISSHHGQPIGELESTPNSDQSSSFHLSSGQVSNGSLRYSTLENPVLDICVEENRSSTGKKNEEKKCKTFQTVL